MEEFTNGLKEKIRSCIKSGKFRHNTTGTQYSFSFTINKFLRGKNEITIWTSGSLRIDFYNFWMVRDKWIEYHNDETTENLYRFTKKEIALSVVSKNNIKKD